MVVKKIINRTIRDTPKPTLAMFCRKYAASRSSIPRNGRIRITTFHFSLLLSSVDLRIVRAERKMIMKTTNATENITISAWMSMYVLKELSDSYLLENGYRGKK